MHAKLFGWTLAVAAPLLYVVPDLALAEDEAKGAAAVTIVADVVAEVDAEDGAPKADVRVFSLNGADNPFTKVLVAHAGSPLEDVINESAADPNRGWLGVQLAEVPPSLVAHFPRAENGVLINNVAVGSPAEQAGLQRHDVITSVNGQPLSGGIGGLAETVGAAEPGSAVSFGILRNGRDITVEATLSSRPAGKDIKWTYELFPETVYRQMFNAHGKILSKDEDGNWHLEDLGDLSELEDLPDTIRELLPGGEQMTVKIMVDDDQQVINAVVVRDGTTIAIEQKDGGEINVTRTDPDGNETQTTYADAEALKAADPEAYEVYESAASGNAEKHLGHGLFGWRALPGAGRGALLEAREEWKEQIEAAMEQARQAADEARQSMHTARELSLQFRGLRHHPFFWDQEGDESAMAPSAPVTDKARRSFRINPDGEIEAVLRKGDTEVIRVYRDDADLQARDPELYAEYAEAMADE